MKGRKSKADREAVLADYRTDMTVKAISKKHGLAMDTVTRWAEAAGIARPKRSRKGNSKHALRGGEWVKGPDGIKRWVQG
jgi:transposase-like protein